MSEHYYTENPNSPRDRQEIAANLRGNELTFITDAGVFSRRRVDFGSELLIETVEVLDGARVLDLGCGYGPIGIAIAKSNPNAKVVMVDINNRAIEIAQENTQINGVTNVDVMQSDGFANVSGTFDVIVSNPPFRAGKDFIYTLFEQSKQHLSSGGSLYIVIQKKQGGNSAIKKLTELFGNCRKVQKKAGFWILQSVLKGE